MRAGRIRHPSFYFIPARDARHGTGLRLPVTVMGPVDGNVKGTSMHRWGSDGWQMIPLSGLFLGDAHMVATSEVPAATHAGIAHPMFIPHVDDLKYEPFHVCDSPFGPRGRGAMQIAGHATGAQAAHEVTQALKKRADRRTVSRFHRHPTGIALRINAVAGAGG